MSRPGRGSVSPDVVEWIAYLKEIGIRELHVPEHAATPPSAAARVAPRESPRRATIESPSRSGKTGRSDVPAALPILDNPDDAFGPRPDDPAAALAQIRQDLGDCDRCKLANERTNIVFGVGDPRARLMFVGEGPGAEEDARGEPFVGRAGKKLDEMIVAIGLSREQVYIANIVKCRPPGNRDPQPDEVGTCSPFLYRQIGAIRPAAIVTLGSPATRLLLNTRVGITKLRGTWQSFRGIPVMPTFHPAYLLRAYTPENRRKVWEDLKAARARLDEPS